MDDVNRFDFLAKVKINKLDCMFLCLFFEGQGGILKCTDVPTLCARDIARLNTHSWEAANFKPSKSYSAQLKVSNNVSNIEIMFEIFTF